MGDKPETFIPIVIGDFLKHTGRLSRADVGAYFLILMDYWINGPPPDDDDELAQLTRSTPAEWKRTRAKLVRFFTIEGGVWRQKRADREFADAVTRKAKAEKAAAARWKGHQKKAGGDAPSNARSNAPSKPQASIEHPIEHMLEGCPPSPSPPEGDHGPSDNVIPLQGASAEPLPADDPRRAQAEAAEAAMTDEEKADMQARLRELATTFRTKKMPE